MGDRRPKLEQRIAGEAIWAVVLLALALFETSLAPTLWRFRVDWVLVLALGWTLLYGLLPGVRIAIYGGLALDLLSSNALGTHLLALLLSVMLVALLGEPLDREAPQTTIPLLLVAALLYSTTLLLVLFFESTNLPWRRMLLVEFLPTAIINTLIALPTLALLRRWQRRNSPEVGLEWS